MQPTWLRVFDNLCGTHVATAGASGEPARDALAALPRELWLAVLVCCAPVDVIQYAATCTHARRSCAAARFELCGLPETPPGHFNSLFFHHYAIHRVVRAVAEHFRSGWFQALASDRKYLQRALEAADAQSLACRPRVVPTPLPAVARGTCTSLALRELGTFSGVLVQDQLFFTTFPRSSSHAAHVDFSFRGNTATVRLVGPAVWTGAW